MAKVKVNPLDALVAKAAELDNHTETKSSGDFVSEPPPAGVTVGRFVEYIELGVHPQRAFRGLPKNPTEEVRITFELTHPKNVKTVGEGEEKFQRADKISLTLTKHLNDKAKFKKLFEAMRYGRQEITHYAQMLGEAFVITIVHNESEKDGVKKVYANITDAAGNFLVGAPFKLDALDGTKTPYSVPKALSDIKLFLWNIPTLETWESLFIEGEREKDGKQVSKNWMQAKILSAINIHGSALEQLLESNGVTTDVLETEPEEASLDDLESEPVSKPVAKVTEPAKAVVRNNAKIKDEHKPVDPLVALGLA